MKKEKEKKEIELPEDFDIVPPTQSSDLDASIAQVLREWTPKRIEEKTEITREERFLLPLLRIIATNPYPQWSAKTGKKLQSKILLDFINEYDRRGLSVQRKSRAEITTIFTGLYEYVKARIEEAKLKSEESKVLR